LQFNYLISKTFYVQTVIIFEPNKILQRNSLDNVARIVLCKRCKFDEEICYSSEDME